RDDTRGGCGSRRQRGLPAPRRRALRRRARQARRAAVGRGWTCARLVPRDEQRGPRRPPPRGDRRDPRRASRGRRARMTAAETDRILDAGQERLLALASHLITVDSQIPPYGDERAIVAELQRLLPEWGLPAGEVLAPNPERPSLIVRIPGSG